jgi:hypothetical protein
MCEREQLTFEIVKDSLGVIVVGRWERWRDAAAYLREVTDATCYEHFERLAARMDEALKHPPQSFRRRAWDRFTGRAASPWFES